MLNIQLSVKSKRHDNAYYIVVKNAAVDTLKSVLKFLAAQNGSLFSKFGRDLLAQDFMEGAEITPYLNEYAGPRVKIDVTGSSLYATDAEVSVKRGTGRGLGSLRTGEMGLNEVGFDPDFIGLTLADLTETAIKRMGFSHHQHAFNSVLKDARNGLFETAHGASAGLQYAQTWDRIPASAVEAAAKRRR